MSKRLYFLALAVVGAFYLAVLVYNSGFAGAIGILISFLIFGAGAIWGIGYRFLGVGRLTESILLSILFAPIPLGVGAWLSSVTGIFGARYLLSALGVFYSLWVVFDTLKKNKVNKLPKQDFKGLRPLLAAWALGAVALIPSLFVTLSSQKIADSSVRLYNDIPWQIAMTSETLVRPAEYFPFLSGVKLAYPWTFHGFLGTLGSFSGVSASTLVTQVWPILFAFLLPLSVGFFAWRASNNKWVTLLAPISLLFFVGPAVPFTQGIRFPIPYSISPTYEFGILALLAVLTFLTYGVPQTLAGKLAAIIIVIPLVFVASGSKGSNGLILVSIFIAYLVHSLATKANTRFSILLTAAAGLGALGAYTMTISGDSNNLNFNSLSFLAGATSLVSPVIFLMVCIAWLLGIGWVIWRFDHQRFAQAWPAFAAIFSGIFCLALFGHPGQSQIYFYWSVVPLLIVLGIWAIQLLFEEFGIYALVPLVVSWVAGQILDAQVSYFFTPDVYAKFKWFVLWGIILLSVAFILWIKKTSTRLSWKLVGLALAATSVFSMTAQPFGSLQRVFSGAAASTAIVDISSDQLAAFSYLKENSESDTVIATNHHCLSSVPIGEDCDARSASVAAFTERRVLIEGHYRPSNQNEMARLALNDAFIYSPTPENHEEIWNLGVRYVYIDKAIGIPVNLSDFGTLISENTDTQIWKLSAPN